MKRLTFLPFLTLLICLLAACTSGNQRQADMQTDHTDPGAATSQTESTELSTDLTPEQARQILTRYLAVKDALVQTNGTLAQEVASQMLTTLGAETDALQGKMRLDVQAIAGTADPKEQRTHFNSLSDNVYAMLVATKANESPVYRQYCPMAFNNTGAFWLAAEAEVNNPYFGDMMLHCGKVTEEL